MLSVTRGDNGRVLADALAGRLATPLADPLQAEEVVVHSRGMERWLSQHLSRGLGATGAGDGVCANVVFPFPIDVIRRAIRATGGPDPRRSVWAPDRLVWPLMVLVEGGLGRWAAPLTDRLVGAPAMRFAVLRRVADLLDSYAVHRPGMVLSWLEGKDVDAAGGVLDRTDRWQPELLRALRAAVDQPTLAESVVTAVAGMTRPVDVPARVSVFGFTALPAAHLAVLAALGGVIDVDLYLLHPSPALWDRWDGRVGGLDARGLPTLPLRGELSLDPPRNRLLRSWGRDASEMQLVVDTLTDGGRTAPLDDDAQAATDSLLGGLQRGVRDDEHLPADSQVADRSLQVHVCHGRARQVQVLRDEILRLMAADETLRPRDIVVMCPDVEAFAPLVQAHLAVPADDPDGRPDLRVRLADRSLRQVNPLLRVVDDLLRLATGRLTLTRLLDLAGSDPVRRRFAFSDDDLEQLETWAVDSGMRWGIDVDDRRRDGVPVRAGTITAGLTRMLLGAAVADEDLRTVGGVTPLDSVEGADVALAGRFAELVARLDTVRRSLQGPQPLTAWLGALAAATDLLLREPFDEPWQRTQLTTLLAEVADSARAGTDDADRVPLELTEVRTLLADRLRGQPSWANHRTGDLTVCTLVPMRSVPHRVVCLLGMDDEVFPRSAHPDDDDLIARHPRVGDRSVRTEDRQLLLDAVMSATDAVLITYAGVDERTGEPRPPCVPVAELLREVDRVVDGGTDAVTTVHPLHAHDPAAFAPGRPGFDPQAHAAAQASLRPTDAPPALPQVDVDPDAAVDIGRLVAFAQNPAAYFYRHTVGAYVPEDPETREEQVPLNLGPLVGWALGEALVQHDAARDGAATAQVLSVVRGRGTLPPGSLGDKQIAKITGVAAAIGDHVARLGLPTAATGHADVDAVVGDRRVVGRVGQLDGDRHVTLSYSTVKGKGIIAAWVRLLALTLTDPERPWEAWVVGRHAVKKQGAYVPHAVQIPPLGATAVLRQRTARDCLSDLLALHDDGLREPLVAPASSASAYAIARLRQGRSADLADDSAAAGWEHDDFSFGKDADLPAHLLLFGDAVPYETLRRQPARPVDTLLGRDPEPHRFGGLAVRLWNPVLSRLRAVGA